MPAQVQGPRGPETIHYPLWQRLGPEQMSAEDFATASLDLLLLGTPGALRLEAGTRGRRTVLLHSTEDSRLVPEPQVRFFPDPRRLAAEFTPDPERYVYALRIRGPVGSAFPEGAPPGVPAAAARPLEPRPVALVVIADVDFLHERFWARLQQQGAVRQLVGSTSQNMSFLVNLLEDLAGSRELASIRQRAGAVRPFTRLQALERVATARYQERLRELQSRLREIETRLAGFDFGGGEESSLLPGPQARQAWAEAQAERVRVRRELRDLQYELRREVRSLQNRVRLAVLGGVPALLACFGLGVAAARRWRRSRRRSGRPEGAA